MSIKREFLPKWVVTGKNGFTVATVVLEKDGGITVTSSIFGSLAPESAEELVEVLQSAVRAAREIRDPALTLSEKLQRSDAF